MSWTNTITWVDIAEWDAKHISDNTENEEVQSKVAELLQYIHDADKGEKIQDFHEVFNTISFSLDQLLEDTPDLIDCSTRLSKALIETYFNNK